jgi:hypothetical protein
MEGSFQDGGHELALLFLLFILLSVAFERGLDVLEVALQVITRPFR